MNESAIRVMIVDDEVLIREGLRRIIGTFEGVRVVAVCQGEEAVGEAERQRPDVVLLDVRMPDRDGLGVLADLRALERPPVVAMLTAFDAEEHLSEALHGGASGFLLKDTAPEQLEYAIRELAEGGSVIAPRVARTVVSGYVNRAGRPGEAAVASEGARPVGGIPAQPRSGPDLAGATATGELTARERQVLELLAAGLSNTEIGKELYIATTTVKDHVSVLFGKLGVANRVQAAVRAHQQGLVSSATAGTRRTA
ncbi:response regulator transcription factor [Streptomyces sp. FIT100]|uniref:response regulator n=1 Tax=Streptomyces sp. FIT100 TaxID=2837956 RepID=UPI0021C7D01F|nr:response regulator transcription factor [Streptomyces sp. FIT100]UUN27778.1 response regulator transcription factor [Streptomyces sp. FIT100]